MDYKTAQELYDLQTPEESDLVEDSLDLTFVGTEEQLDELMTELERLARELAEKHGVGVE